MAINWASKHQFEILSIVGCKCGNCGTTYNLGGGYQYSYFGNGIDKYYTRKVDGIDRFYNNGEAANEGFTIAEYFKDDIVAWKCETCNTVNLSYVVNGKPAPFIPSSDMNEDAVDKIDNDLLKKLVVEFYKDRILKLNSSATLVARKILMHLAVDKLGVPEGKKFVEYVDDLKNSDYVSPIWKERVDVIRTLGNEETHKIKTATDEELDNIASVLNNLLANMYS